MKIAVCDDELKDRERIMRFIDTHNSQHLVLEYSSAIPLLEHIRANEHFDVLFLDIQMPDSDGWEVAEQLKIFKKEIYIAMVTVNDNYVFDCFDRVDWFAPKPVSEAKVHKILNNAYDKLFPKFFEFESDKIPMVLTSVEIMYIEVKRNDVFIHTVNEVYKIRESMNNICKQLKLPDFALPHQSYLLNLDYFGTIENNQVVLKNGEKIPLSRNKSKQFYDALRSHTIRRKSNV